MEGSVQLQAPATFSLAKNSGTRLMGGWKLPAVVLDISEKRKIFALAAIGITVPTTRILVTIPAALPWNLGVIPNMQL